MSIKIENEYIEVWAKSQGAELTSIKSKQDGKEYLWQADPKYWNRHAPILFPIVGKLKNDTYLYNEKEYILSQHGFARDSDFSLVENEKDFMVFELKYSEETLKIYPFNFQLRVKYHISGNGLSVGYSVRNLGEESMYFSIGAHPGFNWPLLPNEKAEDYYLEFETEETVDSNMLEGGLLSELKTDFLKNSKHIQLSKELFEKDAIILENLKSNNVSIKNSVNQNVINFEVSGFPYLGIWSKPQGAPFICIEPWFGIADSINSTNKIEDKKGIIKLPAKDTFICEYKISFE